MNRRILNYLVVALIVLVGMTSAAYGTKSAGVEMPPVSTPEQAHQRASLNLFGIDPITLDPAIARETNSAAYINEIFSGLVTIDPNLQVVPDIAQRWTVSQDGKTYTFYLRREVRFHNWKEVTASDFKYSLERACNPRTKSPTAETYLGDIVGAKEVLAGKATEISGVKVANPYTLQITIDAPKAYFLAKLAHHTAFVVDRANVGSGPEWWHNPNGTGPFKLKQWQKGRLLILERNRFYYQEPAKVSQVIFRIWAGIPMQLYERGKIDIAGVYLGDIDRVLDLQNPLNKELVISPQLSLSYLGFNATKPPFDDAKIRQAFCHAIDKDKIIDLLLKGMEERADGILPPSMPGYNEKIKGLSFDPDRARELIRESKYKDPSSLPPITFITSGYGEILPLNAALINMWRQNLGVGVQVRQLDPESYYQVLKEEKDEIFDSGWVADYPDPQNFLDILFHSGSEENAGEYSDPQVDAWLEQARVEQDATTRMRMYQKIEQKIVDDAACLPLFFSVDYLLVKPYVKGFIAPPMPIPFLKYVSISTQIRMPLATATSYSPDPGQIRALSTTTKVEFPTALTFNLEAESDVNITDIALRYKVNKISYAPLIAEIRPKFTPARRVEASWTWDTRKSSLPPGAKIDYKWLIEDAAGGELETDMDTVRFEDNRYAWRTLEVGQVSLFWYQGSSSFAETLLDAALGALDRLAKDTGARLERPVRIYIYANYGDLRGALIFPQEWTGGVAFVEYGIIAIGITPNNLAWGKRTIAHELAHLVTYQMTFNPYSYLPTWLNEGLSMYAEGELGASLEFVLNQAISQDSLISVQSLCGNFPTDPEQASLCYAESYSLVKFLIDSYGRDKIAELLGVFKQGSSCDAALERVYGFDMDGLEELWRASLGVGSRPMVRA